MHSGVEGGGAGERRAPLAAVVVLLALAVLGAGDPARAGDLVRVCFSSWPPYAYSDADGRPTGLSIRVVAEAARRSGIEVRFQELPWKRCLHEVREGALDAAIDAAARGEFLQGPSSFSVYTNTFWVREDATAEAFSLESLRGKTVGLVTGYSYPAELTDDPPYEVDYSIDDDTNMRKLAAGRVDAIVADRVSTMHTAGKAGLALRPLLPSHSYDPLYLSFNKERAALHDRLDAALAGMRTDGFISRVYREHLGVDFDEIVRPD